MTVRYVRAVQGAVGTPGLGGRRVTPDDLLAREELGGVALSPDGRWLAYVVKRPRSTATFHKYDFLDGGDRGDVWLVEVAGGVPQNLTGGAGDGWGYWAPCWSPDSQRLAMLSTAGGNLHLFGWEMRSSRLSRLCDRAVDWGLGAIPRLWVSGRKLLVATLPEGERPLRMTVEIQAAEAAMRAWPKAWRGEEPTSSVLDSGVSLDFGERPQGELVLVDVVAGSQEKVMSGRFHELRLAPDGRHVALFRQVGVRLPQADQALERTGVERHRLAVVTADGALVVDEVCDVDDPLSGSLRWSADSTQVALIGRAAGSSRRVFRYRVADGRVESLTDATLEPTSILWTADRRLLVLAKPAEQSAQEVAPRADWWLLGGDEQPRKLTADLTAVPAQLVPEDGREAFVGLAAGDIFRVCITGGCENLIESFDPKITSLVWPAANVPDGQSFAVLVLAVDQGTATAWHLLDLRTRELTRLSWPTTQGWLSDYVPEHATAVAVCVDRTGSRLWVSNPAFGQYRAIVETNTWLAEIAEGQVRPFEYRSLDGDTLKGSLILPVEYEDGRRYPLIAEVYPGAVFARDMPPMRAVSISGHHALNPQLLAAHGYAVLLPSMPLRPETEASDPYLELTKGVLPAVDKAIELEIADPDRLGVMGQSFGGYGTYGLITQTRRFHAAVALAGFADLVSLYGQFDPRFRYEPHPHEQLFQARLAEAGQIRMGAPPWQDPQRYVRNSPLLHAECAETPLLIIQGDMDYVAMQHGEQFFTALYRQGKRARFVRYWGEGHVFQSPANIRDMWHQIYSWFDGLLKPPGHGSDDERQ